MSRAAKLGSMTASVELPCLMGYIPIQLYLATIYGDIGDLVLIDNTFLVCCSISKATDEL